MTFDLAGAEASARRAYELGRMRWGLMLALPLAALGGVAIALSTRPGMAAVVALLMVVAGWLAFWRGEIVGKAVLPGAVAGLIPFGLAHATRLYGHGCAGGACVSFCMPACAAGGLLAGLWIVRMGKGRLATPSFWLFGGLFASLMGSLGCSCVGYGGVLALCVGIAATVLPPVLRPVARATPPA